jgi:two-component system response regulator HydG
MKTQLLVVDDEVEIRELLRRHFRYAGHEVETASNGLEALERLEHVRTDVIISDIQMPGMDGVELLRRVRQEYPMTRTIMITGYVSQSSILSCMRLGAETCIFKPIESLEELDAAVGQAVQTIRRWWEILAKLQGKKSLAPPGAVTG